MAWKLSCLGLCVLLFACGDDRRVKQLDEPCTRSSQCETGLSCLAGVCRVDADAGVEPDGGDPET